MIEKKLIPGFREYEAWAENGLTIKGEKRHNATITDKQAVEIKKLLKLKTYKSIRAVSRQIGVGHRTISRIARNETWKHIKID